MIVESERLILRPFEERDRDPLAALFADAQVRRFFPSTLDRAESDALFDRVQAARKQNGFHFLATDLRETGEFVGILGILKFVDETAAAIPGNPGVEIGWQFRPQFWGKGLASEGARACLQYAWETLNLPEVVAITYEGNIPSQRVMERIGMTHDPNGNFEHPKLPEGHKLRPHVLYRIKNPNLL